MSAQTVKIPWNESEADAITFSFDNSSVGNVIVNITSTENTSGQVRQKSVTFKTTTTPSASDTLLVIQDNYNLVVVKYSDVVSTYNDNKAGYKS